MTDPEAEAVEVLREAVNAYLAAQNFHGYDDRGDCAEARERLCEAVYPLNIAALSREGRE